MREWYLGKEYTRKCPQPWEYALRPLTEDRRARPRGKAVPLGGRAVSLFFPSLAPPSLDWGWAGEGLAQVVAYVHREPRMLWSNQ